MTGRRRSDPLGERSDDDKVSDALDRWTNRALTAEAQLNRIRAAIDRDQDDARILSAVRAILDQKLMVPLAESLGWQPKAQSSAKIPPNPAPLLNIPALANFPPRKRLAPPEDPSRPEPPYDPPHGYRPGDIYPPPPRAHPRDDRRWFPASTSTKRDKE